jgi:hypothetical protein
MPRRSVQRTHCGALPSGRRNHKTAPILAGSGDSIGGDSLGDSQNVPASGSAGNPGGNSYPPLDMLEHTPSSHVKSVIIRNAQLRRPAAGRIIYEWSEEGAAVRVSCRYEYEVPDDHLTRELERWMLRGINAENLEATLANLKGWLEADHL